MKKHEKKTVNVNPLSNQELIDSYDYLATAASSHDCTGLIPSAPLNPAELDSYEELYPFLPPVSSADDAPEQVLMIMVKIHLILRVNVHLKILCKIPVFS